MIALMLFGFICFKGMGIGQMPDVDFPVLTIGVTWEGAAPEVMESDVVDIIEDTVMGIEGLKEVSSSTLQGSAVITLEFNLGRDIDAALQEVQSKLAEARIRLPQDLDPAIINKFNPEDQPIMWLSVNSKRPLKTLMNFVDRNIKDKFKTISGVGEVFLGGFIDENLRVWIDSAKLKQYDLTVDDVVFAIQQEHIEIPAGRIETPMTESNVRVMGEALNVKDFENIMINYRGGQPMYRPIPLKAVAKIEDGLADPRRVFRSMGQPSVGLGIRKQRGANSVEIAGRVFKRLQEIKKDLPPDYEIGVNFDSTRFIKDAVHELVFSLILAALLTSFVCWIFLGSWSSTLNILLAIPTSLLGTFLVLKFSNFTLNTFTLLGLTLAIGIVVDDAIMVLENIVRHREKGETQQDAALLGSKEIAMAATVATTAIVAIFLPVAFMTGIIGKFFFQFGVTISIAVILSLVEALSFAPMRCSQFLEIGSNSNILVRTFDSWMVRLRALYVRVLRFSLARKKLICFSALGFVIASFFLFLPLRKELMPAQDQSMFLARLQTPTGSSIDYTTDKFKLVEDIVAKRPEVKRYLVAIGGFEGGRVNTGNLFVSLAAPKERPWDPKLKRRPTQQDMMNYFRKELNAIPDVKAVFQDLSMRGFAAQRGFPIEFTVRGPDWEKLAEYSEKVQNEMKKSDLYVDVDSDYEEGMPEVRVYPDRQKAFEHGVSIQTIARTVSTMVAGERINKYTQNGRRYDVRVRVIPEQRMNSENLMTLQVRNNRGESVSLSDLVTLKERKTLQTITRRGRERAIGVFAGIAPGKSQADCLKKIQSIGQSILPEGYHLVLSGTSQTMKESFASLSFAMILGIIIAYMVLASQFNHLLHPITVLLAMPSAMSGALIALFLGNQSLNMFSLIGLILLMGVVKKNSILIVEFTNQLRERGLAPLEALKEACPIRMRPILMTSISTIAAAIPPALSMGPGAETRIPMAIAVIGGLIVSTILTLVVVPCAYLALVPYETKNGWLKLFARGRRFHRKSVEPRLAPVQARITNLFKKPQADNRPE